MLSFGIYSISTNITSNYCQTYKKCTPNIFNRLSMNNKINQTPYLTGQNYALLFFVILFIIVMQIIRIRVRKVIAKCDHIVDSPSDYAVVVSRMPEGVTENDLLRLVQQRRQYLSEDELEKTNNLNVIQVVMGFKMSSFLQAINENKKAFKQSILQNTQFSPVQLPKLQQPSHISIIIFQTQQGKNLFLSQPSRIQKLLYCFCDPCTPLTDYQILGERVSVERAPQPDDIIWENTNMTIKGAICRKILYNFVSFLLLCAGGGVQYGLAVLETKFVQENALFYIGIASSLLVAVMNQVIYKFLVFTAEKERKLTQTMTNTNLIIKMGFFLFLNAGIFMVGAKILAQLGSFQLQGTLSTQITQVMILNAITPHLSLIATSYFDVVGFIKRWAVRNNLIFATQMTANLSYERPAPEISYKYGYLIRTLWLTAFYCPLTPIVIPISIVGLLLNFYIQKCLHSSSYRAPNMVSRQQNATALQLMEFVPLIMSFGQLLIYLYFFNFQITQIPLYWGIPIYISLGLSCLQFILPMQLINKSIYRLSQQQIARKSYKQVENDLEVTYEMVNPGYKSTKKRNRDKILLKYLYSEIEQMIDLKPKQPIKQLLLFSGSKEHHKEGVDEFDPLLILFRNQNLLASFNTNQVY